MTHQRDVTSARFADRKSPCRTRHTVEAGARRRIGEWLSLHYASLLDLPLPPRLTRLLDLLSEASVTRRDA